MLVEWVIREFHVRWVYSRKWCYFRKEIMSVTQIMEIDKHKWHALEYVKHILDWKNTLKSVVSDTIASNMIQDSACVGDPIFCRLGLKWDYNIPHSNTYGPILVVGPVSVRCGRHWLQYSPLKSFIGVLIISIKAVCSQLTRLNQKIWFINNLC